MVEGLLLVGRLESVGVNPNVKSGRLHNIQLLCKTRGGDEVERTAQYWTTDRETGERTPVYRAYEAGDLDKLVGKMVVVGVAARTTQGSGFVNLDAYSVEPMPKLSAVEGGTGAPLKSTG